MLRTTHHRICCALSLLGWLVMVEPALTVDSYSVIDVATLEEAGGGIVRGVNSMGEVIGTFRSQAGKRGFKLNGRDAPGARGREERLDGFFGADGSSANAISELGAVAGGSNTATAIRAFRWTSAGGFDDLGTLPGDSSSEAWDINRHNDVVGHSSGPGGVQAVLWNRNGDVEALGWLRDGDYSRAAGINDSGDVVGTSGKAGLLRAFLWTRQRQMEDLGTIPGANQSAATAINNSGRVVGYSSGSQGERAFLWSRTQGMVNLGTLPGGIFSRAFAINDPGDVVGRSDSPLGVRAVIWTRNGQLQDLNTLISASKNLVLVEAVSIDDQGVILATGHDEEGDGSEHGRGHGGHEAPTRVFLLVP
jgi:probable HAF family extracellular repeat protein